MFNTYSALESQHVPNSLNLFKDLFSCDYSVDSYGAKFLDFIKNPSKISSCVLSLFIINYYGSLFADNGYKNWALHNLRLKTVCEGFDGNNDLCYDHKYVQSICQMHPIQLIKTVRMRSHHVEPLLKDPGTKQTDNKG